MDFKVIEKQQHKHRFTAVSSDKLRGGYYTSPEVANWLCDWAIRSTNDNVLEPSCGDGVFLEAAIRRLAQLGSHGPMIANHLTGVEIIADEAAKARSRLSNRLGLRAADVVKTGDFFSWWQQNVRPACNAVIGNPPFIRYQSFPEPHRSRAMAIMGELGLSPNRLTNIWVPFVAAAAAILEPDGRLALVLPAELLQVSYAAQLRSFLIDRFARIDIVACNELFFENAEQEVVLLLADGALSQASETNACRVTMTETATVAEITDRGPDLVLAESQPKIIRHDHEKWLKYFLTEREITFMRELRDSTVTTNMSTYANINVGVVTGKNEFFVLHSAQVAQLNIEGYTTPLVSRSVQLKGAQFNKADWKELAAADARVHLLHITSANSSKLTDALLRYIQAGEEKAVHEGYKCSIREPWYAVPSVWTPDGFVFRQIHDFPRMVLNQAGATSTDTIHRLSCKVNNNPERVIANTYNWLTAASAEIEGRSYGGGVLELEPTEAERLLMPAKLNGAMPLAEADRLTRSGRLDDLLGRECACRLDELYGFITDGLPPTARDLDENAESPYGPSACGSAHRGSGEQRMTERLTNAAARDRVAELVRNFKRHEADYLRADYNETQARTDFITPLLEAFGWDVHNAGGQPLAFREVIEEATVEVAEERLSKKPDYELRLARQRKLFVEAKKPHVRIDHNSGAAFQTRRYGYSASLPIAILTNFHQLAVYDCLPKPALTDEPHVARLLLVRYDEFTARFDELWPLLSRQAVYSGEFDRRFAGVIPPRRRTVRRLLLRQVRSWRERLATDIHANTPGLSPTELTYAVQLFLSRIIFLRICEDREIERYETLKDLPTDNTFDALTAQLRRADEFYDSGLSDC